MHWGTPEPVDGFAGAGEAEVEAVEVGAAEICEGEDKGLVIVAVEVVVEVAPPDQLVLLLPELGFPAGEPSEELLFQTVPPRIPRTMAKAMMRTI